MKTRESDQSRRSFFRTSVAVAGAGAVAAATLGAQTSTGTTDIALLNYALTLENLEAAFYVGALTKFVASDFTASATLTGLGTAGSKASDYLKIIRDDEVAHVNAITAAIKALGGTPVAACPSYNFTYTTVDEFLKLAVTLEETGVSAYDGAIGLISNPDLRTAAASIATVEARHAAYLNVLTGGLPFPNPFDATKTQAEITAIVAPFLSTGCLTPVTPPPPTVVTKAVANPKNATALAPILLDGSASIASDGKPLTYLWKVATGGKTAAIINANTVNPQVQFGEGFGYYNFTLTVTDSKGVTASDNTTVFYAGR